MSGLRRFGNSVVPPGGDGDVTEKRLWRAEKNQQAHRLNVIVSEHVYMNSTN